MTFDRLAVDIETYDPNLKELGDGSCRNDGYIVCASVAWGASFAQSKSFLWRDENQQREFRDLMALPCPKVFHNGLYDLPWLCIHDSVQVNGYIDDTMTREAFLLDTTDRSVALDLDSSCRRRGVVGKNKKDTIEAYYEEHYGKHGSLWAHIPELMKDAAFVENLLKYNRQDCVATWNLFFAQEAGMKPHAYAYDIEERLYPLLVQTKRVGIRLDIPRMKELEYSVLKDNAMLSDELSQYGIDTGRVSSPAYLRDAFHSLGIRSKKLTARGAESWTADALAEVDHPAARLLSQFRVNNSLIQKYLEGSFSKCLVNGRLHCTFSPNKRDDSGTVTGRFACTKPNLQCVPARGHKGDAKAYGDEMRQLFLPEEGQLLLACDYSQIEYVLLVNFAHGPQAPLVQQKIRDGVDFHTVAMTITGINERALVKTINYGMLYGMGKATLIARNEQTFRKLGEALGFTAEGYGNYVYQRYCEKLPVVRDTCKYLEQQALRQNGLYDIGMRHHPLSYEFGRPVLYKIVNHLIQGSAAALLKRALVDALEGGVFDYVTPHLFVHDEIVASVHDSKAGAEAAVELRRCMQDAYKGTLVVPIKAEPGIGPNWGYKHAEASWPEFLAKWEVKDAA